MVERPTGKQNGEFIITVDGYQNNIVFWQGNLRPLSNGEQHAYKTQL